MPILKKPYIKTKPLNTLNDPIDFINAVFSFGQGGLRYPKPYDFMKDISVPYDYDSGLGSRPQEGTTARPDFSKEGGAKQLHGFPEPTLPKNRPRPPTHKPDDKTDEEPKRPLPPVELPDNLEPDLPFPPEEVPPEVPYYEPDEGLEEDEPEEPTDFDIPDEPKRPDPIIPLDSKCDNQLNALLGLPPCEANAQIQISTKKAPNEFRPRTKNRTTGNRNSPSQKGYFHRANYPRRNSSRLGQPSANRVSPMRRNHGRRRRKQWYGYSRRSSIF